jgi:hypothetical protein
VNTKAFTASKAEAKTAAAAKMLATTSGGNRAIRRPRVASVARIEKSMMGDRTTQRLGRELHRCRQHESHGGKRLQRLRAEVEPERADSQNP